LTGLTALVNIDVDTNQLTGSVPSLSGMPNLQNFFVGGNALSGLLPPAPASLVAAGSSLCDNRLSHVDDPAWDAATGTSPWYSGCTLPATTTTISSSRNPSTTGQAVTFTAIVSGSSTLGFVAFKDGINLICANAALSSGVATCTINSLTAGSHAITAAYGGDANNGASTSAPLTQTVSSYGLVLGSSSNPSSYGQAVTFSATLAGGQSPTGTVTFNDGATAICKGVKLTAGSATCANAALLPGAHSITAVYGGDANNAAATSNTVTQQVNQVLSATSLASSLNPASFGQSVTFTATVSGQSATGTVTFKDGPTAICSAVALSKGSAKCTLSTLSTGVHSIAATYSGDVGNSGSSSNTIAQQVNLAASATGLVSSINPSAFGQSVTFTATVTGKSPTGSVTFNDGSTPICTAVALSTGKAKCVTSGLTAGSHAISANYSGDANNAGSASPTLTQVVNAAASHTALSSSPRPSKFGQAVTFTATVTGQSPTGSVTFNDGAIAVCSSVPLVGGSATCVTSTLSVGVHSMTAAYGGDGNNAPSSSASLSQTVNLAVSSTALTSSANPSAPGQAVVFTAVVTGQSPTGTVAFNDGTTAICAAAALNAGTATCMTSTLSAGTHSIKASYGGDAHNAASASSLVKQAVK